MIKGLNLLYLKYRGHEKENCVDSIIPKDVKEIAERSSSEVAIIGQIWPPSGEVTNVDEVYENLRREGKNVDRSEIIDIFKELNEHNYGQYLVGRRGWPTRIAWNERALNLSSDEEHSSQEKSIGRSIEHTFVLRPGFEVSLILPENLSSREAERLSSFIKTLPFDNEKG